MLVTRVETVRSPCRSFCWILVHTDTGLVGIGETYGRADAAEPVIHEFARNRLLGQDPRDIEKIWWTMYHRASFHGLMGAELRAMSGIDLALWDLFAKSLEQPLYRVLGGRTRDQVPVYFSGIYDAVETTKQAFQDRSKECVDKGWKACKTARFFGDFYPDRGQTEFGRATGYISATDVDEGRRRFEWVREAVGDQLEVGLDLHAAFDVPSAIRIGEAVRDLNPYFIEEPIQPHNFAALKEVREGAGVPIAAGERIFSRWGFKEILELNAADILNPDLAWTGGLSEVKKIAAYAETHYLPVAPHNYGPLTCMALTHLMAVLPNTRHLEFTDDHYPKWNHYIDEPIAAVEGMLDVPERPGLGRELSSAMLALERLEVEAE
ncbi:MAG TPA: mandelate racemase/muconate lactonizing enzyme family protein [Candidatus Latescibacteria bacterium]|nr:mandelate racemase/muconate lactonizing enzyme family protein [Candidatus Handelsmanbacteria bacterium]HIL11408.1 mandelate racemase/muconate lactonizing enzyme family protein [Candidatus Latescibacterota bacterium]